MGLGLEVNESYSLLLDQHSKQYGDIYNLCNLIGPLKLIRCLNLLRNYILKRNQILQDLGMNAYGRNDVS